MKMLGWVLYGIFAAFVAVVALAMSFISDGSVPVYIHIMLPAIVLIIFGLPPVLLRVIRTARVPSPLPARLHKYQDKIIVVFLVLWITAAVISYFFIK